MLPCRRSLPDCVCGDGWFNICILSAPHQCSLNPPQRPISLTRIRQDFLGVCHPHTLWIWAFSPLETIHIFTVCFTMNIILDSKWFRNMSAAIRCSKTSRQPIRMMLSSLLPNPDGSRPKTYSSAVNLPWRIVYLLSSLFKFDSSVDCHTFLCAIVFLLGCLWCS